jgi:hypothetical protein
VGKKRRFNAESTEFAEKKEGREPQTHNNIVPYEEKRESGRPPKIVPT